MKNIIKDVIDMCELLQFFNWFISISFLIKIECVYSWDILNGIFLTLSIISINLNWVFVICN